MTIHYNIEKLSTNVKNEPARITEQWQRVIAECKSRKFSELERARLAFNMVDYITSEDLPLRLLITRAPQAMAKIADETKVYRDIRKINGKNGTFYSRSELILPKEIEYESHYSAQRIIDGNPKPLSSDNLLDSLKAGNIITPLDGILFLQCKRIAIDISRIKMQHPDIAMERIEVSDSFTGAVRMMASYTIPKK